MHSIGSISARRTTIMRPAQSSAAPPSYDNPTRWFGAMSPRWSNQNDAHRRQHPTLVGHGLAHHDVERGHPVGRDHHERAVGGVVEVADLARVDLGERHSTRSIASNTRPMLRSARSRPNASSSWSACSVTRTSPSRTERNGLPSARADRGVLLDDAIGVVAREPGRDEREQHGLAEHEPERELEVREHPLGVDAQAVDQRRALPQARSTRATTSRGG